MFWPTSRAWWAGLAAAGLALAWYRHPVTPPPAHRLPFRESHHSVETTTAIPRVLTNEEVFRGVRMSPLAAACYVGVLSDVTVEADRPGTDIDAADSNGFTPTIIAAVEGHADVVAHMIERGAAVSSGRHTALRGAAIYGRTAVVALLLARGVNPDILSEFRMTALMGCARGGHVEACRLLLDHGAAVDAVNAFGETAVDLAESKGHTRVLALLKEAQEQG